LLQQGKGIADQLPVGAPLRQNKRSIAKQHAAPQLVSRKLLKPSTWAATIQPIHPLKPTNKPALSNGQSQFKMWLKKIIFIYYKLISAFGRVGVGPPLPITFNLVLHHTR
jgi:hypothetical protein